MAAPEGLEPPTLDFEDRYSIQLNYRATQVSTFALSSLTFLFSSMFPSFSSALTILSIGF